MTDRDDEIIRAALEGLRTVRPTSGEIHRAVGAASTRRPRLLARPGLAGVAVVAAMLTVSVSVPAGRAAITRTIDSIGNFLAGSGDPPGRVLSPGEVSVLAELSRAVPGSPRLLAELGRERLVAFREASTGNACFGVSNHRTICFALAAIQPRLIGGNVAPLDTARSTIPGRVLLWGIVSDPVRRVEIRYPSDRVVEATVGVNGFLAELPAGEVPTSIVAYDGAGNELASGAIPDMQWSYG